MLNESVIIGVVLLVAFGAVSLYLYSQLTYLGKKVGMMESLVVDMRMAVDSLMSEDMLHPAPIPISGPAAVAATGRMAEIVEATEETAAPEEAFYSNVLEQAHDGAEGGLVVADAAEQPGVSLEEAIAGLENGEEVAVVEPAAVIDSTPAAAPAANYDAMTRAELTKAAEQRGLHVKKSMSRGEILSLLRRSQPTQIASQTTGTGDVSGPAGSIFPSGASLDGNFPVDLGQNGATLEVDS